MNTEIEVKFLQVDFAVLRTKLTALGATCTHPMRLMRRYTYHTPEMVAKNGYLRIRDEGDKATFTYKQFDSLSLEGAKEIEVAVSSFDDTVAILKATNLEPTSFQESKRETWVLNGVEVVLDEWPWLQPYIEIEGDSEQAVRKTADMLGQGWENAVFGDIMAAYRAEYPHLTDKQTVGSLANVRFDDPLPDMFKP